MPRRDWLCLRLSRYTGSTYPVPDADFDALEAFNPKSFQLISPGIDGDYGWGGALDSSQELKEPNQTAFQNVTILPTSKVAR